MALMRTHSRLKLTRELQVVFDVEIKMDVLLSYFTKLHEQIHHNAGQNRCGDHQHEVAPASQICLFAALGGYGFGEVVLPATHDRRRKT